MNTPGPLVSVVIPCMNRAHFLVPTLESVLRQNYPSIECIVVDGGSKDGTVEILRGYGDRIRWVSEPDNGHADAINKGWLMSHGDILAWLNADDLYIIPDAISKAVAYLQENSEVDVVYGDYTLITEEGKVLRDIVKPPAWDLVTAVKYCHYTVPQATSFMRRSILEKVGWLDADFANGKDHELWLRIGMAGTIRYAPLHLASVSQGEGLSTRLDMGAAKVKVNEKFFKQTNLPAPFNSTRFRNRAMSNSFLVGSNYIWVGTKKIKPTLEYLVRAFVSDPLNTPFILWRLFDRFLRFIFTKLPIPWRKAIKVVGQRAGLTFN